MSKTSKVKSSSIIALDTVRKNRWGTIVALVTANKKRSAEFLGRAVL